MPADPVTAEARAVLATLSRSPEELWLVACSGGPDSLTLLSVAAALRAELNIRLGAVYVDHGLRPAARLEGTFVCETAARLGLATQVLRVDVRHRAARERRSLMDAARAARYDALDAAAVAASATRVLLGHTADDQTETVLMRLLRGTGVRGLAGIPWQRGRYVRPLLGVTRAAILEYLAGRGLRPLADPSNEDRSFLRPVIRHDILPALRSRHPDVDGLLLRVAARARSVAGTIDAALAAETAPAGSGLSIRALAAEPRELRRARLAREHRQAGGAGLCSAHYHEIERLLGSTAGSRGVDLPGGLRAERRYDRLLFVPRDTAPPAAPVTVTGPGRYRLFGQEFVIEPCPGKAAGQSAGGAWHAHFDPDALAWPLRLRGPQPGDRIRPRGFGHRRKLSDLLGEAHVPVDERGRVPLLTDQHEVLLVPGLRASERGRPGPGCQRLLRVAVHRT